MTRSTSDVGCSCQQTHFTLVEDLVEIDPPIATSGHPPCILTEGDETHSLFSTSVRPPAQNIRVNGLSMALMVYAGRAHC